MRKFKVAASPTDIPLQQDSDLPQIGPTVDTSNTMFQYIHQNTLDGFPISPQAQGLPVARQDQLRSALSMSYSPKVFMKWVQPESPELDEYQQLLQRVPRGQIIIEDQTHQYDAAKGKMLIFIKYSQIEWTLNPRYEYLNQQKDI